MEIIQILENDSTGFHKWIKNMYVLVFTWKNYYHEHQLRSDKPSYDSREGIGLQ